MQLESVDISIEELDQLVDEAASALSEEANRKLRALVNTIKTVTELLVIGNLTIEKLRRLLLGRRSSEKTRKVLGDDRKSESDPEQSKRPKKGHGRNGAADYRMRTMKGSSTRP